MADATTSAGPDGPWQPPVPPRPGHPRPHDAASADDVLDRLLDADRTAVVVVRTDGEVEHVNAAMLTLLDVTSVDDLGPGSTARAEIAAFLDQLPRQLRAGTTGTWSGDVDHPAHPAGPRVLRATARVAPSDDGRPRIALLLHDVSDARRRLSALRRSATHDSLTGFVDRSRLLAHLTESVAAHRSADTCVAVLSIDVDRLKHINDALGHEAGDRVLASAGRRLEAVLRPLDRIARVGGDEFLVVCPQIADADAALQLGQRVERALRGAATVGELSIEVAASVGVAVDDSTPDASATAGTDDAVAAASLVGRAETAMSEAKRQGGARALLDRPRAAGVAASRADLAPALLQAIARGAVGVEYQPVFSMVTGTAVGVEALARWHHPTRGAIDPRTFIAVAEETGLIGRLGEVVLQTALRDLRAWIDSGAVPGDFTVHVNVSVEQLASPSIVDTVTGALRRHHLVADQLVLDAREPRLVSRPADVDRAIRALRQHGVNVAVDDFGVGVQALELMTGIGADVVKLDGSLALPAGSSDEQARLVRAVVLLAHALDIGVVAERVDEIDQLRRLRAAGCDMVQGNLLGPPRPATDLVLSSAVGW